MKKIMDAKELIREFGGETGAKAILLEDGKSITLNGITITCIDSMFKYSVENATTTSNNRTMNIAEIHDRFGYNINLRVSRLTAGESYSFDAGLDNDILVTCIEPLFKYTVEHVNVNKNCVCMERKAYESQQRMERQEKKILICN